MYYNVHNSFITKIEQKTKTKKNIEFQFSQIYDMYFYLQI